MDVRRYLFCVRLCGAGDSVGCRARLMCKDGDLGCQDSAMRELCGAGDSVGCRELVARELCGAGDSVGCRARVYVVFVNDSL